MLAQIRSPTRTAALRVAVAILVVASALAAGGIGLTDAQVAEQRADLAVQQPDYVDGEVRTQRTDDRTVYIAQAGDLTIAPQNFGNGTVVDFGVETDAGQLTYNEAFDTYEFSAEGETGSFELYWSVEETRQVTENNTTLTETVRTRYTAVIRVESIPDVQHISNAEYEQTQEDAANWSAFQGELEGIFGQGVDTELRTQEAVNLLLLRHEPLSALSGGFSSTLLLLVGVGGPGGLLVGLLWLAWHLWTRRDDIRYRNKQESLKPAKEGLDDMLATLQDEERRRELQNLDWNDIIPDDRVARAMREIFGETVFDGVVRLQELLLPEKLVRDRLRVMGANDYVGVYTRAVTDGGDGDDEVGEIVLESADVIQRGTDHDHEETLDLQSASGDIFDAYVAALDWDDPDLRAFDLAGADLPTLDGEDVRGSAVEMEGMDLEELMTELDVQGRDFDTPDVWGEYLLEFVESVRASPYCDEHGRPDTTRYVLNNWLQVSQTLRDRHDFPLMEFTGDAIERALLDIDPVAEAEETVRSIERGEGS